MFWVIGIAVIILVANAILQWISITKTADRSNKNLQNALLQQSQNLSNQIQTINASIHQSLIDTRHTVSDDLKQSGQMMSHIHSRLGELQEFSKKIYDIGEYIVDLQSLLKSPKLRGGMGEYFLTDLLEQIVPESFFSTQHSFRTGHIVDAIIKLGDQIVCIDSKFPMDGFKAYQGCANQEEAERLRKEFVRVVKKHIGDINEKYIRPDEGTLDFALMFIPAESIYYEFFIRQSGSSIKDDIFEFSIKKRIIPVSPNSLYAYLQVISLGLRGFQLQKRTKDMLSLLDGLKVSVDAFQGEFQKVGKHLMHTQKTYERAHSRLDKVNHQVEVLGDNSSLDDLPPGPSNVEGVSA